jgi:hypothetical protein
MAARIFDIYDLNSAFVEPTAPTTAAPTTAKRAAPDRMLRAGAYLLTFAGAVLLLAVLAAFTPVGRIDADVTVPVVAVTVVTLAVIAWDAVRA